MFSQADIRLSYRPYPQVTETSKDISSPNSQHILTPVSIDMILTISSSSLKNFQTVATSIKRDSKILRLSSYQ